MEANNKNDEVSPTNQPTQNSFNNKGKYLYQNEYDDSCFMATLINLFSLAIDNDNNDDSMIIIHTLQSYSIQMIEKYINLLIGFYVIFNESNKALSTVILEFLQSKAKYSLKFSHLIFFNLLSCKNNYKKHLEYEQIKKIMINLMNDWEMPLDYNIEKSYSSLFNFANNFEDFCKKNLVKLKAPYEYVKDNGLKFKKGNDKPDQEVSLKKWEVYASEISFINDIVLLSEVLRSFNVNIRNGILLNFLKTITQKYIPIYFNYPFDDLIVNPFSNGTNAIKYLRCINLEYSFCLSTKEHVPYHLLLELSNDSYNSWNNNHNNKAHNSNGSSDFNVDNKLVLKSNSSSDLDKLNGTNPMTQGMRRFFSLTYYLNNLTSMLQCVRPDISSHIDDTNSPSSDSNMNVSEKNQVKLLSPDSIGLFGKITFSQIKEELTGKGNNIQLLPLIIKGGEDLRQDYFVSQATSLFLSVFQRANLDIFLQPLQILPTGRGGIMKTLPDTTSLMKINKVNYNLFEGFSSTTYYIDPEIDKDNLTKSSLRNYFIMKYGKDTEEFDKALGRFIQSLTGYSLLCYFLEIKDRNNGNILINDKGYLIHIDFGFLLGRSPGNVNLEQAPFKLTWDFVELMMGVKSKYFEKYRELMIKGLIALRKEYRTICGFVKIFIETNADLLCFNNKDQILTNLEEKFFLNLKEGKELEDKVNMLIFTSLDNWRTLVYDQFQKFCVGIN